MRGQAPDLRRGIEHRVVPREQGLRHADENGAEGAGSRRTDFLSLTELGQLLEVPKVEGVNTFCGASRCATQQQCVVNLRATPSAACHRVHGLKIVLFAEGHDLKMQQDILGDDARRFRPGWMRGWTGRRVSAANTSAIECWPMYPLSCPEATRSSAGLACV